MSQDFVMAWVGWPSYPWAGMIATLSAIAVLILEGCVTALFQRGNSDAGAHSAAAPPQAPADVESSKDLTTAYVHGHAHCQGDNDTKVDKVRHLTIAQVRPSVMLVIHQSRMSYKFGLRTLTIFILSHSKCGGLRRNSVLSLLFVG